MRRPFVVPVIVLAVVVIGIVIYLVRPRPYENEVAPAHEAAPATAQPASLGTTSAVANCLGSSVASASQASVTMKHQQARALMLKNEWNAAIPALQNIAVADPGYPAINLEISQALLKSKRANEAEDAIKNQLEISECLANLPPADVQVYCTSEWMTPPAGGCTRALAKIGQDAHYQAGLVDAELRRGAEAHAAPIIVASKPQPAAVTPAPAAAPPTVAAAPAPETVAPAKPLPLPVIKGAEAVEHVGQRATVCGAIVSKKTAETSNGKPTFVNLDSAFPSPTFTIVYWGNDSAAVGDFPETGRVCVSGMIAMYRSTPQIVIHDAKNWYKP